MKFVFKQQDSGLTFEVDAETEVQARNALEHRTAQANESGFGISYNGWDIAYYLSGVPFDHLDIE